MIIAKCSSCHHELQTTDENVGDICGWCRQGTIHKIADCEPFDPYKFLGKMRRHGRSRP